jgi:hypothetical protein
MASEGIALRLMHLYRLQGATADRRVKAVIQREIDALSAKLDQAFAAADVARQTSDRSASPARKSRRP